MRTLGATEGLVRKSKKAQRWTLCFFVFLLPALAKTAAAPEIDAARADQIYTQLRSAKSITQVKEIFEKSEVSSLASERWRTKSLATPALHNIFQIAFYVNSTSPNPIAHTTASVAYDELVSRKEQSFVETQDIARSSIINRTFEYIDTKTVTKSLISTGRALQNAYTTRPFNVYEIHNNPDMVVAANIANSNPDQKDAVYVVFTPNCKFARTAALHLRTLNKPQLASIAWIAAQTESNLEQLYDWKRLNPNSPLYLLYENNNFRFFDSYNSPTFYLFKGPRLVDKIEGWNGAAARKLNFFLAKK